MELKDLNKDIQRLLLEHWTETEINQRLDDPEYFFDQVVNPRLSYLRRQGLTTAIIRLKRSPHGKLQLILNS